MIRSGTCSSGSATPSRRWPAGNPGDGAPLHRAASPISSSTRTRMARSLPLNASAGAKDRGGRCGADSPNPRRCIPACRNFCTRRCRTTCSSSSHLPGLKTTKRVKRSCDGPSWPWRGRHHPLHAQRFSRSRSPTAQGANGCGRSSTWPLWRAPSCTWPRSRSALQGNSEESPRPRWPCSMQQGPGRLTPQRFPASPK